MVDKFTGTGFNANALNLDFLRDKQGNPLKTPNSFLVLHNPVRKKINDIIDYLDTFEYLDDLSVVNNLLYFRNGPAGGVDVVDGLDSVNYSGSFRVIDAGDETIYADNEFNLDGGDNG